MVTFTEEFVNGKLYFFMQRIKTIELFLKTSINHSDTVPERFEKLT